MRVITVVSLFVAFAVFACEERSRPARSPAPLQGAPIEETDAGADDVDAGGPRAPSPSVAPGPNDIKI